MDQAMVDWAVTAMDFGDDTVRAEQWFKLLTAAYHDPDEGEPVAGWDEFVARLYPGGRARRLRQRAGASVFVESLRDSSLRPDRRRGAADVRAAETRLPQEYLGSARLERDSRA